MSRTYRKDEHVKFQEGNPKKLNIHYRCRCGYCTRVTKRKLEEKIADEEMLNQIAQVYSLVG